jgi:hypothetical protein
MNVADAGLLLVMVRTGQGPDLPAFGVLDLRFGAAAGVSEVPVRIAHHPLGAVVMVVDRDVGRHTFRVRRARGRP